MPYCASTKQQPKSFQSQKQATTIRLFAAGFYTASDWRTR